MGQQQEQHQYSQSQHPQRERQRGHPSVRWAGRILAVYEACRARGHAPLLEAVDRLNPSFEHLIQLRTRLRFCHARGWRFAAAQLSHQMGYSLREIRDRLCACEQATREPDPSPVTLRLIHDELVQLQDEFDEVRLDRESNTLSAITGPITLEGIHLGRFEIQLELNHLRQMSPAHCLRLVALEPNHPTRSDTVTHPHVQDERLCPGEASGPMLSALRSGRLCDLFMLARSVLETHNPESSYVRLSQWQGRDCHDCGYTMDEDASTWCEGCDHELCEECTSYCRRCDVSRCRNCLRDCVACGWSCCQGCLTNCESCSEPCCSECLTERCCEGCRQEQEEQRTNEAIEQGSREPEKEETHEAISNDSTQPFEQEHATPTVAA